MIFFIGINLDLISYETGSIAERNIFYADSCPSEGKFV
jgi:hypothetical protein